MSFRKIRLSIGRVTVALAIAPLMLAGIALPASAQQPAADPAPSRGRPLVIATGAVTGLYYPAAGAICRIMNQERVRHGYRCLVEATSGPVYNLNALRSGEADMALVQSDWQRMAYKGEGRFAAAGPFGELRAVASLHMETLVLLARPEAGIGALADLKGKRVNHGPRGSALRNLADMAIMAAGLKEKDDEAEEMGPDQSVKALCDGGLDAAFLAVGHPNSAVDQAITSCGAVPVPLSGPAMDTLLAEHPELAVATVPAALYKGLENDVATIGVVATLVARADADDAAVAEIVWVLTRETEDLAAQHPLFSSIDQSRLPTAGRTAPLHPAAEKATATPPKSK